MITRSFLHQPGLAFSSVLNAASIRQAFEQEDACFADDAIFSTEIVLWAFLAQTLRDGKGAACAAAVTDIAAHLLQTGQRPPSGDTGDYCRARAKLNLTALQRLVRQSGQQLERAADPSWLWKGRHAKLVDGFTFTMPDTPANQEAFPQQKSQTPGVGFPIARACAVLSLATAGICDLAIGPYEGKETGELALLRRMLETFDKRDVVVFDRYYCSYMMLAMLIGQGVDVCTRLHSNRASDFHRGRRLGPDDHRITWYRPAKPVWMSVEAYETIPEKLELRELRFDVKELGRRTQTITVITTLTDPRRYPKEEIANLYGFRWNVELDILQIKQTLNLDHLRCKSPEMVSREVWVTLVAYNLIRKLIATAAVVHDKQPRRLGFTRACQTVLVSWILFSTESCYDAAAMQAHLLASIAANEVANRPGRIEPRVLKRRRHRYPLMQCSRQKWRTKCEKT
jgi:hypothetical protein